MRTLFTICAVLCLSTSWAQEECEVAHVSDHIIVNNSKHLITLLVDNKNQKSFPTDGPTSYSIKPGEEVKVSSLEWAGEFRDPTGWYVFKVTSDSKIPDLNNKANWKFKKKTKTTGTYQCTVE